MSFCGPTSLTNREPQSPGLGAGDGVGRAFEIKYRLRAAEVSAIEAWARANLVPDGHGSDGAYRITSVYCDTPQLDVFHRTKGYRRTKFRVRRYGASDHLFLEQKSKRGDRVRKSRVAVAEHELVHLAAESVAAEIGAADAAGAPWDGEWFLSKVRNRNLKPICRIAYDRMAFFGASGGYPIRLTVDRNLLGAPADSWQVPALHDGVPLLPDEALVELKFHESLPPLFHDLLPNLPVQPARVSKYRLCVGLCGIEPESPPPMRLFDPLATPMETSQPPGANGSTRPSSEGCR